MVQTSILFSDIVGFTVLASSLSTKDVVMLLNELFSIFDNLVDMHGIYKVETIGAREQAPDNLRRWIATAQHDSFMLALDPEFCGFSQLV